MRRKEKHVKRLQMVGGWLLKTIALMSFTMCFVAIFFLNPAVVSAAGKTYKLAVAHFAPMTHHLHTNVFLPYVEELKKESGGRLKVTLYPAGAMGKPSAMFDTCRKKIVDVALLLPMYTPGVFLLSEVVSLPFAIPSADIGRKVVSELLERKLLDPPFYKEIVSWMATNSPYQFFFKKKVTTLEGLKGLKLRTPGGMQTEALKALGATPVTVPGAEFTTAMERGIINGGVVDFSSGPSYKLQDLSSFVVKADMGVAIVGLAMNREIYESLPQDLQKVIDTAGKNWAKNTAISYDEADKDAEAIFNKAKIPVYRLEPSEKKRWIKACEPVYSNWITDMKRKGFDSEKLYSEFKKTVKKYGLDLPR